jgi:hypothetical protein
LFGNAIYSDVSVGGLMQVEMKGEGAFLQNTELRGSASSHSDRHFTRPLLYLGMSRSVDAKSVLEPSSSLCKHELILLEVSNYC